MSELTEKYAKDCIPRSNHFLRFSHCLMAERRGVERGKEGGDPSIAVLWLAH